MDQQPYSNIPPQAPPQYGYPPHDPQNDPNYQRLKSEAWQTARNMHEGGIPQATIYDVLMKKGLDPATAQQTVLSAMSYPAANRKGEAGKDMLIGGILIVVGIVITVATYSAASSSSSGGHYLIAYGPVIYGVIRFFKGVSKL